MPALIALDTSTNHCSVAFINESGVRACHRDIPRAHNQHVLQMIDEVVGDISLAELTGIVCGIGPGSFTGLRVAVSVAQGLAWGLDIQVAGLCSLELQAMTFKETVDQQDCGILSITDAQIGQVYARLFAHDAEGLRPQAGPILCPPDKLQTQVDFREGLSALEAGGYPIYLTGSGASLIASEEGGLAMMTEQAKVDVRPSAEILARHAFVNSTLLQWKLPWELQPHYVQQDIGWKKLGEQGNGA